MVLRNLRGWLAGAFARVGWSISASLIWLRLDAVLDTRISSLLWAHAERRRRRTRVARAAVATLAVWLGACATPTRSRLDVGPPGGPVAEHLASRAVVACQARRGPEGIPPHPFTTDGCSLWPDGGWVACCVEHDLAYWCGGSADERARADAALARCVSSHDRSGMGPLMGFGVRPGGVPWMPVPWRWGYGWDYPAGYSSE